MAVAGIYLLLNASFVAAAQILVYVGAVNVLAYADIDTGSNTSYSNVSTGSNTSYSDVATGSNTSYNDVTGEAA